MTLSRRRPPMAARLIAVPSIPVAAAALAGAAPAPGSQPWLVVGLAFFGVAAVGMLAAVGIKMRRTPKPPQQRPPAPPVPPAPRDGRGRDGDQDPSPDPDSEARPEAGTPPEDREP